MSRFVNLSRRTLISLSFLLVSGLAFGTYLYKNKGINADVNPPPTEVGYFSSVPEPGTGNLQLTIKDKNNNLVKEITAIALKLENENNGAFVGTEATSDEAGILTMSDLAPGIYKISFTNKDKVPIFYTDTAYTLEVLADKITKEEIALSYPPNVVANFRLLSLGNDEKVAPNSTFNLKYSLTDPDSDAKVTFYLDNDKEGYDGSPVGQPCGESQSGTCALPMNGQSGTKYIYAIVNEDSGAPQVLYAQGSLTVEAVTARVEFHTPATNTSTGQNQPLKISYSTLDVPSNANVSMYLAPADQKDKGGQKINQCQNVAKGSKKSCDLNSSDYSPGEYVIQAQITVPGGSNSLTYSPVFTITPAQPVNVSAKLNGSKVTASWRDNTTRGGGNAEIVRSTTGPNGEYVAIGLRPAPANFNYRQNQSFIDPNQISGAKLRDYQSGKYYYKVRTYSQKANGGLIYSPFSPPIKGVR